MDWAPLALAFGLVLGGCTARPERVPAMARSGGSMRYLALGDSYTIGEGVAGSERWPERLAARLAAEGVPVVAPEVIARTGWTTAELARGIDDAAPHGPYALVTLMIGVNNQYRGLSLEAYRSELLALVARAVTLAGGQPGHVIVVSIPDWGVTPYAEGRDRTAIAREIDRFNAVAHAVADDAGARWADVTPASRRAAREPGLVAGDGLHPSPALHDAWTEVVLPEAQAVLAGH